LQKGERQTDSLVIPVLLRGEKGGPWSFCGRHVLPSGEWSFDEEKNERNASISRGETKKAVIPIKREGVRERGEGATASGGKTIRPVKKSVAKKITLQKKGNSPKRKIVERRGGGGSRRRELESAWRVILHDHIYGGETQGGTQEVRGVEGRNTLLRAKMREELGLLNSAPGGARKKHLKGEKFCSAIRGKDP